MKVNSVVFTQLYCNALKKLQLKYGHMVYNISSVNSLQKIPARYNNRFCIKHFNSFKYCLKHL